MGIHQAADPGSRSAVADWRRRAIVWRARHASRSAPHFYITARSSNRSPLMRNWQLPFMRSTASLMLLVPKPCPVCPATGMPSTMRGARSNVLETNSSSWPFSNRRSKLTNRFPWGAVLAAVIAFSKAFESTLNRSASPTWMVLGTAARRLAVMPFLLISELNDESAMFTVSLAQKRRTAVRSPASQSSSMRSSASSVWPSSIKAPGRVGSGACRGEESTARAQIDAKPRAL